MLSVGLAPGAVGLPAGPLPAAVVFPRGEPAHVVATPRSPLERRVLERLTDYLSQVTGQPAVVARSLRAVPAGQPAVLLVSPGKRAPLGLEPPGDHPEAFALATGSAQGRPVVAACGRTARGLKRAVQRLIIASRQSPEALRIPPLGLAESPWIARREWTLCPWDPLHVRGVFLNPEADRRMDIYRYSRDRLGRYVAMLDAFGFSGAQLMETSYTYGVFGSIDAAQEWQCRLAGLLRENGQEVSLWAWAAQFTGFGWQDPEVTYTPAEGRTAFEDPRVRAGFEKYYDHYAALAPDVDRFFAHFYDPGELTSREDVFAYMRLLEAKLKTANPDLEMGADCWAATPDYLVEMAGAGFQDYLMLPSAFPEGFPGDARLQFHRKAHELGLRLGIWGWYMTEYESDQGPSMFVNALLLKGFITELREGALQAQPVEYWSEMEANHLTNIYSVYCAGQLLWDPDRDPQQLLGEISEAIFGPRNGPVVLTALELVQEVRSGPSWETYWWTQPTYRLGTADPGADRRRAEASLTALRAMVPDEDFVPKVPLPWPPAVFVELLIPHLEQIRLYAHFRVQVQDLRQAAAAGAPQAELEAMLRDAWQPVPEFGTWVGTFGPWEVRAQKQAVQALRQQYGLDVPDPAWLRHLEADRLLQTLRSYQRRAAAPVGISPSGNVEFFWPEGYLADRIELLHSLGLLERAGDDRYQLANWQAWAAK
jgi:hypothetical protein